MYFAINTTSPGSILNVGICAVIALMGTVFLLFLLDKREQGSLESLEREQKFIFKAFTCWVLSWWVWIALWAFETFVHADWGKVISLSLSDCNTILVILFYLGLTRGRTYELARYVIHGFMLFSIILVVLVGLYVLGGGITTGFTLHIKWSIGLSMFSPLLVGWAVKLRYDTDWGLITGLGYAVAQPIAYEALFGSTLAGKSEAILIVLALLKVVWATTITYYIGFKPVSEDTLILPHRDIGTDSGPMPRWKILLLIQFGAGIIVTAVIARYYQIAILQGAVVFLATGFIFLVGLITGIKTLAVELQKWVHRGK